MSTGRIAATLVMSALFASHASAQVWPLEPDDEKHPVLSVIEFKRWPSGTHYLYFHPGIDIFGASSDDPSASLVIVVTDSVPTSVECNDPGRGCSPPGENGCFATLEGQGGSSYEFTYGHLECGSYRESFFDAFQGGETLTTSDPIGQLFPWEEHCGGVSPDHLHFELFDTDLQRLVSPTEILTPFHSLEPPTIHQVILARDDVHMTTEPWEVFPEPAVPGTCRVVAGNVDVLVNYSSRFRPDGTPRHGDNLGARFVRWRACDGPDPDCAWAPAYDWTVMDSLWAFANLYVEAAYSVVAAYESESEFVCGDDVFYAIPTNIGTENGVVVPLRAGAWKTVALPVSPSANAQHFTLTVEVEEFGGAKTSDTLPVCVAKEDGPGIFKLLVRDCEEDQGTEPSGCEDDLSSLDVTITPTAPAVSLPMGGTIQVCMRNIGNASLAPTGGFPSPSVSITVTARSSGAGGAVAAGSTFSETFPRPIAELRSRLGTSLLVLPWTPGEERCAEIDWPTDSAPSDWWAYDLVEISVARDGDDPNAHPSVLWDNNRAAHDTTWGTVGTVTGLYRTDVKMPDAPPDGSSEPTWVTIEMMLDRNWTTESMPSSPYMDWPVQGPTFVETQFHIGPGVVFEGIDGGIVIGTMETAAHAAWEPLRALRPGDAGLVPPGRNQDTSALGARTDVWRIVAVPQGSGSVILETPGSAAESIVSAYAWPRGGGPRPAGPRYRARFLRREIRTGSLREVEQKTYRSLLVPARRAGGL